MADQTAPQTPPFKTETAEPLRFGQGFLGDCWWFAALSSELKPGIVISMAMSMACVISAHIVPRPYRPARWCAVAMAKALLNAPIMAGSLALMEGVG